MSGASTPAIPAEGIVSTFKRLLDADVAVPVAAMNSLVWLQKSIEFTLDCIKGCLMVADLQLCVLYFLIVCLLQ